MINKNRIIFFIGMCILTLSFSSNIVYSDNVSKNLSVTLYGADILNAKEGRIEPVVIDISPFMENRSVQMVLVFGNPDEKIPLNETDFKVNTYPPILAVDDKVILNRYGILLPLTKFGSLLPISKESLAKHPGSEKILFIPKNKDQGDLDWLKSLVFGTIKHDSDFVFEDRMVNKDIFNAHWTFSYNLSFYGAVNKDFQDISTGSFYRISNNISYFCPLSFELGDWPEQLIHFDIRRDEEKMVVNQFIVDFMNLELTKENIFIIYGKNITLIVNKPNDNYYFLTNNAETDSPILSICSNLTSDETKLFEGVKTYFINQPFNPQRIGELVYFLENPVKVRVVALNESMIESQNVSITPIYEGYFLGLTKQLRGYNAEIIVKVKADELKKIIEQNQTLEDLNFTYLLQDGVNRTIPVSFDKKTREYRFSETIPLMGNPVYYPIDEYENAIYLNPPRFIEKPETSQSDGFIIQSDFSNDRVKITVKRDVCLRYALGLIVSIICSCFLIRYIKQPNTKISRPETQMKIIAFIFGCVLFGLISFVSLDLLKSIGILPFGIILIVLSGFAYKKIRK